MPTGKMMTCGSVIWKHILIIGHKKALKENLLDLYKDFLSCVIPHVRRVGELGKCFIESQMTQKFKPIPKRIMGIKTLHCRHQRIIPSHNNVAHL